MANSIKISKQLEVRGVCANIDALYGPYISVEEACAAIPIGLRSLGRTVGILDSGSVIEYWWKSGVDDEHLVQKVEQLSLSLHLIGESSFIKEEGELIYGRFMVEGGAGVKRAVLYQVIDGNEIYLQEYNNIGKGSPYTFTIPNPSMSGVYSYRIKVLDTLDNYAITGSNTNYIEYTLYYGGISTVYNLTQINSITVKNYTSVANQPFQINISVRDDTFRISNVRLTDSTDENPSGLSVVLTPYVDPTTPSETYFGNNYYFMPDSVDLKKFNGKRLSIVVSYMEGETSRAKTQDLFKLLDISTLDIIPEYEGGDYYATLPGYYIFRLESGVENLSIVLTPGEGSDFNFERSTVLAYRRYTLRVIPNNVEKSNAQIVINYRYIYNNVEYSGSFTRIIGNILPLPEQSYYEPEQGSSTSMIKLIDANQDDYTGVDDGQYYKVISEEVSTEQLSSSFLLDTYCKINQQNDKSIKYIQLSYGGIEIASVTEDEISCVNKWGSLYTDTPINEWTQIGIGINLRETITRNNEEITGYYHCIYINGMAVKTVLIDGVTNQPLIFDNTSRLVLTVGNGVLVQKCFLYFRNDGENMISPNTTQGIPIIYNNYKSHKRGFEEPQDLPVLKFLKINNVDEYTRYFNLINTYKEATGGDEIKHLTSFGRIGVQKATSMAEYDPNYSSSTIESGATLFRQSVDIKKSAQKAYAVLCRVQWMGRIMEDIIVEVHTQGTSTLVYSIPNFKFTFWRIHDNSIELYYPEFIQKEGTEEYYRESVYTAKADFMDSSHINNTPTCNYYNNLIQNLIDANVITGSPSARNGMLDAILGFPIVMEISDTADDFGDIFTNIGSFMLNIDKTGNSLGFEVEEEGQTLSCISFEGTSNDNGRGAAGRFDIPDGVTLKDYTNQVGEVDEAAIIADYAFVRDNVLSQKSLNDYIEYEGQTTLVRELPYVKWCLFFADGLEYRYPDADIYKEKNSLLNKVMSTDDFIALYKMWWWVYKSDTLSKVDYQTGFIQHFDLQYCMLYFINLMTYAQTDNLGKNAMFDSWDKELWYPRPYDLDSEAGLDNNGNDNIAPFVEIRAPFSLNYDVQKENDYAWRAENYLIDEVVTDPDSGITYQPSTIQYGTQTYDRYHFSSNKSKLWINFYKNFKDEIEAFYNNLRNNYGYGPESIIALCKSVLIDKLGTAQYNQDFQNKYLANNDQRLAYGNRWYKFRKWITKRFAFCDSYFGATESAIYDIVSRINYTIKVDAPQYVAQQYQGAANRDTRFVLDNVSFSAGSGAATKITLLVNQPSVFETTLFKNATYSGTGDRNYRNLITLDVSGNKNQQFTSITSVTGDSLDNLKYLNISNSAVQNLSVPPNLKTLLAENVSLSTFTLPSNCAVEEISLKGSTFLGAVDFSSLPNLKRLDLTDCVFNQGVTFAYLPQLEELVMDRTIFNNIVTISNGVNVTSFNFEGLTIKAVSFSGSDLNIDTVNFHNTKFGVSVLNLNAIRKNIRNLYFDNCQGLTYLEVTDGGTFDNLNCLSLDGSSINALGANNAVFDGAHFVNMSSLKKVSQYTSTGAVTYTNFTFKNTVIEQIVNLNWTGTGAELFMDCQKLTSIGGTLNITTSADYLFYRCYLLSTLPTITVHPSTTSAIYMLAGTNALSYSDVVATIAKCTHVSDFNGVLRCKQFDSGQVISLDALFGNNTEVNNLSNFLSQYRGNNVFVSITNDVIITGKIPSTVINATWAFYGFHTISVPYDLLSAAESLTTAPAMFAFCQVTFTGNGRPQVTDTYGETIILSNAINKNFLSNNLVNIAQMFYSSNVITNDPTLFANLSNLTNTNATFSGGLRKFSFVNSHSETEDINLNVTNMWAYNSAITNISACFANVYNVYCNGLRFHSSITSSNTIDISGLFGISDATYRAVAPITIDIDSIVPKVKTDCNYAIPNNSNYNGYGVFQNRSVYISSTPVEGKLFDHLTTISKKLFLGAVVYLPNAATIFDLSNVQTSCLEMFMGCRLYTTREEGHTYGLNDRKFVDVLLPTNCSNYSEMFRNSSVLKTLPALRSSGASNLSYMYAGCVINTPNLELPSTYFQICANNLTNVSYMFYRNKYLTTLEYSATRGLFEGCVNLTNANYMFSEAYFLHKGVPVNFFGTTDLPRLTSLAYMFGNTSIIFDVEDNSHKWFNASTIQPLINLDNIQGLFYRNRLNVIDAQFQADYVKNLRQTVMDVSTEVALIDPNTFAGKTITNITKLFEHTVINPPASVGSFRFMGFTIGDDAFFSSSVANIDANFVDEMYVSSIARANRMFYQSPTGGRYNSTVTNLATFVNNLVAYPNTSKYNIAGNIEDNTIPETYRASTTEADQIVTWGHNLSVPADPEASWSDYGRYDYTT